MTRPNVPAQRKQPPGLVPKFRPPNEAADSPPEETPQTSPVDSPPQPITGPTSGLSPATGTGPAVPPTPQTAPTATLTVTSSTGEAKPELPRIDAKLAARAGVVVVGVVAMLGGLAIKWRSRGALRLRHPTEAEARDIADPIASILSRRVNRTETIGDVLDVLAAIAATGRYLDAGDLTIPARVILGDMPQFQETGHA